MLLNSPIKSDLYFLNTTQFINNRWGTKNPIIKRDPDLGMVRLTAFGTYSFKIKDVSLFMKEVFGARSLNMTYDIVQYLTSMVGEAVAQCLGESTQSVLNLATHYRELTSVLTPYVNVKVGTLGLEIAETVIESIGLPQEVEKLIDEQSGIELADKNMDRFIQYQSARAIRDAAQQPGGLSGMGAGMAVGKVVAKNISGSMEPEKKSETVAEQILKYKQLFDSGALTQAEFDQVKASLLGKL
jgi:membrane protease subunit (stomatin/prohibitin family)